MELPLDHFQLIGVSPSASSEEILRAFQLRLDKTPDEGFTYETLTQRSELLRLTADLLTDPENRREYENLLLKGASGLDLSTNREVAGLILLWESGSPKEAFKIAKKVLQPPQTPALGSSRESDLTLLAALTARDAAIQEQSQRSYSNAADFLQEGIQILQRMGKLRELRKTLEEDLVALLPFRILDLLSRDLNDYESHKKGINMLESLIIKRGGLEGKNKNEYSNYLDQKEFESFFQQIRPFLTVQEQVDLFSELQKNGSIDAGFLAFLSLTAIGFARRKPDKLFEARKVLKRLNLSGLDSMPLLGCLDLLLADIDQASARFLSCSDEKLKDWLINYPGERLEAICIFCKNWLENDVLVGFRDIDLKEIDLDSWFEDREIQEFIEKLEKKTNRSIIKQRFQNQLNFDQTGLQNKLNTDSQQSSEELLNGKLPLPGGFREDEELLSEVNTFKDENVISRPLEIYKLLVEKIAEFKFNIGELFANKINNKSPYLLYLYAFLILFTFGIGIGILKNNYKKLSQNKAIISNDLIIENEGNDKSLNDKALENRSKFPKTSKVDNLQKKDNNTYIVGKISNPSPSLEQIEYLINTWLFNKSIFLAGVREIDISDIVQDDLILRLINERQNDIKNNVYKSINTKIKNIELLTQTSSRIAVSVELDYVEKIFKSNNELINETSFTPFLKVKYILGYSNDSWKLVDYVSGV